MKIFIESIKQDTRQEKALLLLSLSIFLPFYVTAIIFIAFCIYALVKKEMQLAYSYIKGTKWLIPFTLLSIVVSLFYKNYVGALASIVILAVISIGVYYGYYGNQKLLKQILKIYLLMSILCGIYAMIQYRQILINNEIETFKLIIFDKPKDRIQSVFYNANYYAMMCEFFALITVFLFLFEKENIGWKIFYVIVGVYNLFFLYMTACRTAWPALAIGVVVLCLLTRDKKYYFLVGTLATLVVLALIIKPELFPRIDNVGPYFSRRLRIFNLAIENFKTHPLFGEGPLTYYHVYENYTKPIKTQHAHNFILDPLMNYGIVGVGLILPFFIERAKSLARMVRNQFPKALVISFIIATMIHGLLDFTVYFVPTGFFFFLVLMSAEYKNAG